MLSSTRVASASSSTCAYEGFGSIDSTFREFKWSGARRGEQSRRGGSEQKGQTAEGSLMASGSRHQAPTGGSRQHAAGSMQLGGGGGGRQHAAGRREPAAGARSACCGRRPGRPRSRTPSPPAPPPPAPAPPGKRSTAHNGGFWPGQKWARDAGLDAAVLERAYDEESPKDALITALFSHALAATKSRRAADCIYRYCSSPAFLGAVAFLSKGLFTVYF